MLSFIKSERSKPKLSYGGFLYILPPGEVERLHNLEMWDEQQALPRFGDILQLDSFYHWHLSYLYLIFIYIFIYFSMSNVYMIWIWHLYFIYILIYFSMCQYQNVTVVRF